MKIVIVGLLCLALLSCVDKSGNVSYTTIPLNDYLESPSVDITDRIDSVYIVPLETTEESLIGDIRKIIITDTRIIVFYKSSYEGGICFFDDKGHFLKNISSGDGPNELVGPYDMCYDKEQREILVAQNNGYIKHLSEDGVTIDEEMCHYYFSRMYKTEDGYLFGTLQGMNNMEEGMQDIFLYKTNNDFVLEKKLLYKNSLPNYGGIAFGEYNETMLMTQALNDTIYTMNEGGWVEPKYLLDYSKSHFDASKATDVSSLVREFTCQDAYSFDGLFLESDNYQYLSLTNHGGSTMLNVFINKNDGQVLASPRLETDKSKLPFIQSPFGVYDNYFVSLVHSFDIDNIGYSEYLSEKEVDILNSMTDDDNNILLFFKLKG